MNLELDGKVALVTGSSGGIGLAIAQTLRSEGCNVILNGRNGDRISVRAKSLGAGFESVCADVSTPGGAETLRSTVAVRHQMLDVLVCNVGSGRSLPPLQENEAEWRRMLDINLFSALHTIYAMKTLLSAAKGVVLCISSICGSQAIGCPLAYASAKAALDSFVKNAARPLAANGIRINALAPGNILFPGSVWEEKLRADPGGVTEMLNREVPLGRLGTAREVADFAAFLVSPRSAYATGTVFVLDGGQLK